jgi:hypothetical protein
VGPTYTLYITIRVTCRSDSLAHCITQKNQIFTHSPVFVHMHIHSIDPLSHYLTQENHFEFLVNSAAQRRLIHHLHFYSHDDALNTLGFHTFTLCSATSTSNSKDRLSHWIIIWSSSQLSEWRRSSLRSSSVSGRNHVPFLGAFSQVCKLEKDSHSCNDPHLTGLKLENVSHSCNHQHRV